RSCPAGSRGPAAGPRAPAGHGRRRCRRPPPPGPSAPRATRRPPTVAAWAVAARRSRRAPDRSAFRCPCASPAGQAPFQLRGNLVGDTLGAPALLDVDPRDLRLSSEPRPLAPAL